MATEIELFQSPGPTQLDFGLWGLDEEWSLQKKNGYMRPIAGLHFEVLLPT